MSPYVFSYTVLQLWIPDNSTSRMNMEWLWDNYPNDIRFHTMIFEADNVLDPKVIRAMYSVRKRVSEAVTESGDTWEDMCQRVPIVRPPDITKVLGKRRRRKRADEFDDFGSFDDDDFFDEEFDDFEAILQEDGEVRTSTWLSNTEDMQIKVQIRTSVPKDSIGMAEMFSVESYPDPYCEIVDGMATACLEMSILELLANDGAFDERTEQELEVGYKYLC